MSVQAKELKSMAEKVLYNLGVIDYSELQLIYALKTEGKWKVSFACELSRYRFSSGVIRKLGSFVVDDESEEIEGMWLDRLWQ